MSKIIAPEWQTEIVDVVGQDERSPERLALIRSVFDQARADYLAAMGLSPEAGQ